MENLKALKEIATGLVSSQNRDELCKFIDDIDAKKLDVENDAHVERIRYFEELCRHVRGYKDIYVEGYELTEWEQLTHEAAEELRKQFDGISFPRFERNRESVSRLDKRLRKRNMS